MLDSDASLKTHKCLYLLFAAALSLSACATTTVASRRQSELETEIRQRSRAILAAEVSKNLDAIMPFWSADAVIHMEGAPAIRGPREIRTVYEQMLPTILALRAEITDVHVAASGDLAYETGTNYITLRTDTGPKETTSKYLVVWRIDADGQWRIAVISLTNNP